MNTSSKEKTFVLIVMACFVTAVTGYIGYFQIMKWHDRKIQNAVLQKQEEMSAKSLKLEKHINQLKENLERLESPAITIERITEVLGESSTAVTPDLIKPDCDALNDKIKSFFDYLKKKSYVLSGQTETHPSEVFLGIIKDLSTSLPLVIGETQDIINLVHNQAHFFRALSKDRIEIVKKVLSAEEDVLEHVMANFYAYYVIENCCKNDEQVCISFKTLYEYAAFFLQTLAGQSYLMRRDSAIRCLTNYYSIIILDKANAETINRYGVDIRPHIDLALEAIRNQNNLKFQEQYLNTLTHLKEKYRLQ